MIIRPHTAPGRERRSNLLDTGPVAAAAEGEQTEPPGEPREPMRFRVEPRRGRGAAAIRQDARAADAREDGAE